MGATPSLFIHALTWKWRCCCCFMSGCPENREPHISQCQVTLHLRLPVKRGEDLGPENRDLTGLGRLLTPGPQTSAWVPTSVHSERACPAASRLRACPKHGVEIAWRLVLGCSSSVSEPKPFFPFLYLSEVQCLCK